MMMYETPVIGDQWWDWPADISFGGFGSASVIHGSHDTDPADEVRKIAEEVAGEDMPRPAKPRMGFL